MRNRKKMTTIEKYSWIYNIRDVSQVNKPGLFSVPLLMPFPLFIILAIFSSPATLFIYCY